MMRRKRRLVPFVPPSEGFWSRLIATPLSDLVRGRLTGRMDPRRLLARAQLPLAVQDALWMGLQQSRLHRWRRVRTATLLIDQAAAELESGRAPDDVAAQIAERARLLAFVDAARLDEVMRDDELARDDGAHPSPLPARLLDLLVDTVDRMRGGRTERQAACLALYRRFAAELAAGESVDAVWERFGDAGTVARFLNRPRQRDAVCEAALPADLLRIVQQLVTRARLWPGERDEVTRELCAHFADGLAGGHNADELAQSFGSPRTAARLIRRAKLRNRPLAWRAARRSAQGVGVMLVTIAAVWIVLAAWFYNGRPTIARDFIAEDDAITRGIPREDRAWPHYRQGLIELIPLDIGRDDGDGTDSDAARNNGAAGTSNNDKTNTAWMMELLAAMDRGPKHPDWPRVVQALEINRPSLAQFLAASARPRLGYVYRDAENDSWLAARGMPVAAEQFAPGKVATARVLPHVQDLFLVGKLLHAAAWRALDEGNASQFSEACNAQIGLADQLWHGEHFAVVDIYSCILLRCASRQILRALADRPQLLNDEELRLLAHRLAAACDGDPRIRRDDLRLFVEDFLQQSFTDDGNGNGRLTSDGLNDLLAHRVQPRQEELEATLGWDGTFEYLEACGPLVGALAADRRETRAVLLQVAEEVIGRVNAPPWLRGEDDMPPEMRRLLDTPALFRRYLPALVFLAEMKRTFEPISAALEPAATRRDGALTAIALELYRRRHGSFPARLDDLTPQFLPVAPRDPFDGEPLRYRLAEGRPVVYSVGLDRVDDFGRPPAGNQPGWSTPGGDWRIFPPVDEPAP